MLIMLIVSPLVAPWQLRLKFRHLSDFPATVAIRSSSMPRLNFLDDVFMCPQCGRMPWSISFTFLNNARFDVQFGFAHHEEGRDFPDFLCVKTYAWQAVLAGNIWQHEESHPQHAVALGGD